MTRRPALPSHPPGPEGQRLLDALDAFAALPLPEDRDEAYRLLSDARHVMIRAEAVWEQRLAEVREAVRGTPPHNRRPSGAGQWPRNGWAALVEQTGLAKFTVQTRLRDRPGRRQDQARQAAEAERARTAS